MYRLFKYLYFRFPFINKLNDYKKSHFVCVCTVFTGLVSPSLLSELHTLDTGLLQLYN